MQNVASLPNPYNFSRPVADGALFAGRQKEIQEIAYYLDQAQRSTRPMSLALLGERAAGKSSLLNAIEREARTRGLIVARIDLDEGDAQSQLGFFSKLFDSIFTAACEAGHFEGVTGRTYDTYLDITQSLTIPDDKTFCPFLFPTALARATSAGNYSAPVSDAIFRRDLATLHRTVVTPIVILIDEGNVLSGSRILLEKLRNIFDNENGFMLVITGTPALFPMMDEVFSPIIRSFKKIEVRPFDRQQDTQDCIWRPLLALDLDPHKIIDFSTIREVRAIHDVSGGRPYEIQLLCHMLFRRVQEGLSERMTLSLSVLEDVRRELEKAHEPASRPVLTNVARISADQFRALRVLFRSGRDVSVNQAWAAEFILRRSTTWTYDLLRDEANRLIDLGFVSEEPDGKLRFSGDEFDKLYLKYFARERGIPLSFPTYPVSFYWSSRLQEVLGLSGEQSDVAGGVWDAFVDGELGLPDLLAELESPNPSRDRLLMARYLLDEVYALLLRHETATEAKLMLAKIELPELSLRITTFPRTPNSASEFEISESKMNDVIERVRHLGGDATIRVHCIPVLSNSDLAQRLCLLEDESIATRLAGSHLTWATNLYLEGERERAHSHVCRALLFKANWRRDERIRIGYMLSAFDRDEARSWLEKAAEGIAEGFDFALARFDLSILDATECQWDRAQSGLARSIHALGALTPFEREVACVVMCEFDGIELAFKEVRDPNGFDLLPIAEACNEAIASARAAGISPRTTDLA